MIKDIAENANAMRLKIAFSLNHIKMCLKILSWKRRERKVYLICIFFFMQESQWKDRREKIWKDWKCACFRTAAISPSCLGSSPVRGFCAHASIEEFDKQPQSYSENQKPKDGKCFYRPLFCFILSKTCWSHVICRDKQNSILFFLDACSLVRRVDKQTI